MSHKGSVALTVALTIVAVILVVVILAGAFIYSGVYNVAASAGHYAPVRWVLSTTMVQSVRAHAEDITAPDLSDPAMAQTGFEHFRAHCVQCHGAPGVSPAPLGNGLTPEPPSLSEHVPFWTAGELFWITRHGIKMAGMPAWGHIYNEQDMWAIVAFLQTLPEMTAEEYQAMVEEAEAEQQAAQAQQQQDEAEPAATIGMTNSLKYEPARVTVQVGDTVLWRNNSDLMHTVTADPDEAMDPAHVHIPEGGQPFNSGNLAAGETFRHTFETPGRWQYFCIPHEAAGMIGEVIVE